MTVTHKEGKDRSFTVLLHIVITITCHYHHYHHCRNGDCGSKVEVRIVQCSVDSCLTQTTIFHPPHTSPSLLQLRYVQEVVLMAAVVVRVLCKCGTESRVAW